MLFEISEDAGIIYLKIQEEIIDHEISDQIREKINEIIKGEHYQIVMDLSLVRILHSVGIGMLVSMRKFIIQLGGKLTFSSISPELENIFQLTGVMRLLEIEKK